MATLPFAARSFDMVWSNLSLHWTNAPQAVFSEIRRVLKPDGVLMFSTLGPDTLKELRACFAATDRFVHVNRFVDLHDLGDMLVKARFADPVMDMEALTLTYEDLRALLRDLKAGGAGNLNSGRNPGLSGKTGLGRVRDAYERYRQSGRLPATFEIVYGQAWRTGTEQRVEDGRSIIRFHPNRRAPPP
jgi:malonyl-CoA O-methyltransferase